MLQELTDKKASAEKIAQKLVKNSKLIDDVIQGVSSEDPTTKFKSAKVLRILSEKRPDLLYAHWEHFAERLSHKNTFLRSDAALTIANLASIDKDKKFEKLFDRYYDQLNDESMIAAANLATGSEKIALAKPHLQTKIIGKLLKIDETRHSQECKNIIKGDAIETFMSLYPSASQTDKKKILSFVKAELKNSRPGTRKKAERFIKKIGLSDGK